jgi:arsenate reductase (glutaredoxin)
MKTNDREILVLYNEGMVGRQVIALARSMSPHVRSYTFREMESSQTQWCSLLDSLKLSPKELMDKSSPYYQERIRGRDFDKESWLSILRKSPELIKAPIALRGHRAVMCTIPTEVYKLA